MPCCALENKNCQGRAMPQQNIAVVKSRKEIVAQIDERIQFLDTAKKSLRSDKVKREISHLQEDWAVYRASLQSEEDWLLAFEEYEDSNNGFFLGVAIIAGVALPTYLGFHAEDLVK